MDRFGLKASSGRIRAIYGRARTVTHFRGEPSLLK